MGVTDALRGLIEIAKQYDNAELNQRILDLQSEVGDLQQEKHELEARTRRLKQEIEDLREKLAFKEDLTMINGVYWVVAEGEAAKGPFCPRCWDVDRVGVWLNRLKNDVLLCPECENNYGELKRPSRPQ